jgi:hypothetical protein
MLYPLRQQIRRATASIKKPIHNVKEVQADPATDPCGSEPFRFISGVSVERLATQKPSEPQSGEDGGAYRDRTDDLMLAKQPLSQLS